MARQNYKVTVSEIPNPPGAADVSQRVEQLSITASTPDKAMLAARKRVEDSGREVRQVNIGPADESDTNHAFNIFVVVHKEG